MTVTVLIAVGTVFAVLPDIAPLLPRIIDIAKSHKLRSGVLLKLAPFILIRLSSAVSLWKI